MRLVVGFIGGRSCGLGSCYLFSVGKYFVFIEKLEEVRTYCFGRDCFT